MSKLLISFPGNEVLSEKICNALDLERAEVIIRKFPDGESYVRLLTNVSDKEVIVVASLDRPDNKVLTLLFLLKLLRDAGAKRLVFVSPYLAYMRQDKQFQPGEAVTSTYFAALLSSCVDELITIDPHLHRRKTMGEIYTVPTVILHAATLMSEWIRNFVHRPLIIGPDSESEQWVAAVAKDANAPYLVLTKQRYGDRDIKLTIPDVSPYRSYTPVLVDDIIATARTMIDTVKQLQLQGLKPPVCIGVHGIFADDSYLELKNAGTDKIATSNSIPHSSNQIDVSPLIIEALK